MAFPSVSTGDVIQASHIMDIVNAFDGTLNKGVRIQMNQYNSSVNFAVAIRNLDTTNHRALQVLKANDDVMGEFAGAQVQVGNVSVPVDLAGPTAGGGAAGAGSGNYIRVSGGATGVQPALTSRGEDANIDIQLVPKGSGKVDVQGTATVGGALNVNGQLTVTTSASTTHKFTVSGANQVATLQLDSKLSTQTGTLELAYNGTAYGKIYANSSVSRMYMDAGSHEILVSGVAKLSLTSTLFKVLTQGEVAAGTLTTSDEFLDVTGTWNSGITTFTAFRVSVTDTASAAGSKVVDTLVGGVSQFSVGKSGDVTFRGNLSAGATRSLTAYNGGGVHIGQSPSDPGTNNFQVQGTLFAAGTSYFGFTRSLTIYDGGGVYVGRSPADPGANNLKVQGALTVAGNALASSGVRIGIDDTDHLIDDASNGAGSATLYIGNASINVTSDIRYKKNVHTWGGDALALLKRVRVVEFEWDDPTDRNPYGKVSRGKYIGTIAQDMVDIAPWIINTQGATQCWRCRRGEPCDEHPHPWLVEYEHLVPTLVRAIQQLWAEVEQLKGRLGHA